MKGSLETRLGIFFALALLSVVALMELSGGLSIFRKGYVVSAQFTNAQELKLGDQVKMSGFEIGKVSHIDLKDGLVQVDMHIREPYIVRTDSVASISFVGLMGRNFVAVTPGALDSPAANDGTLLESIEQPDFGMLMKKLDGVAEGIQDVTQSFSGDGFSEMLAPLSDFMSRNGGKIDSLIANLEEVSGQIASGEGTVGKLIYEDSLYASAMNTVTNVDEQFTLASTELRKVLQEAYDVLHEVNEGQGTIGRLVKEDSIFVQLDEATVHLKEILEKINTGEGTIGQLVNDASFLKNVKMTIQKLERATDTLEDAGPLTVISVIAGGLL